jgi:large subunit ribosomal protein L17
MRHRLAGVRLSRTSAHRKALFSNLIAALFYNERIRTTDAKAKETRRLAERTITWARRVGDVLGKKPERRSLDESARVVHAVRMARRVVRDRGAVLKLFDELAPRFVGRAGGYTRIIKLPQRPGDAAPMSMLELLPEDGRAEGGRKGRQGQGRQGRSQGRQGQGREGRSQGRREGPRQEGRQEVGLGASAPLPDDGARGSEPPSARSSRRVGRARHVISPSPACGRGSA